MDYHFSRKLMIFILKNPLINNLVEMGKDLLKIIIINDGYRKNRINKFYYSKKSQILKKLIRVDPKNRLIYLGGGANWYFPRWENIDFYHTSVFVDYKIDFRLKQSLPFEKESVLAIFTSHVLEHLDDNTVKYLLLECYKILKSNGILRISVPDMDKAFKAYKEKDHSFFDKGGVICKGDEIERKFVNFFASYKEEDYSGGPIVSPEEVKEKVRTLDKYSFCKWCVSLIPQNATYKAHINAFDYDKLRLILKKIGFRRIYKSRFRKSRLKIMQATEFDNRPIVSLYIEAIK
jgi:SAM-dependent methyltransferase